MESGNTHMFLFSIHVEMDGSTHKCISFIGNKFSFLQKKMETT